jgi:hypothetical protein
MAAPVMGNGRCIGALMACFAEDGSSGERLEQTARFANQLSVCIERTARTLFKGLALDTSSPWPKPSSRDPTRATAHRRLRGPTGRRIT